MKSILVLQHVPHETLGTLEDHFSAAGLSCQHVELFRETPDAIPLDEAAGLVVLGGPMNVDQIEEYPFLAREVQWIRQALDRKLPILGVCLGSQLLAKSLGAKVYPNGVKEIGWYDIDLTPEAASDPLFGDCGPREPVFQWHGDTFDLPPGAVLLATSPRCRHQVFRYGDWAWGLQFHVEMNEKLVEDWLDEPGNQAELRGLRDPTIDSAKVRRHMPQALAGVQTLGDRVLPRFAALCR